MMFLEAFLSYPCFIRDSSVADSLFYLPMVPPAFMAKRTVKLRNGRPTLLHLTPVARDYLLGAIVVVGLPF